MFLPFPPECQFGVKKPLFYPFERTMGLFSILPHVSWGILSRPAQPFHFLPAGAKQGMKDMLATYFKPLGSNQPLKALPNTSMVVDRVRSSNAPNDEGQRSVSL